MRRSPSLALAALPAVLLAGCQEYNWNPVSGCLVQPGQRQIPLNSASTADVLFVVDDSGSTDPKQQALAQSFAAFIQAIAAAQKSRAARGLRPFEFHVAVTTSSVFRDYSVGNTGFSTRYENLLNPGCTQGVAVPGGSYPQGDFVAASGNAKVLHFTSGLNWATWDTDTAIGALIRQFVGTQSGSTWSGGNVEVGSCGSGEEQHMEAARLALAKALAGQQPGISISEFPHLGAKLVVVFVGDEDDCSSSASRPLVLTGDPGNDSCVADRFQSPSDQRLTRVSEYASYLAGLVAPSGQAPTTAQPYLTMATAFVVSAAKCSDGTYVPADSCVPVGTPVASGVCPVVPPVSCASTTNLAGAYGAGVRFLQLADLVHASGYDALDGSVCEPFGPMLAKLGDLVEPPDVISLPTVPAASDVTILKIVGSGGALVKVCSQARSAAAAPTAGWWFADCNDRTTPPAVAAGTTACIYINHAGNACEANPGETYAAEYLGQLPAGGCVNPTSDGTTPSADCAAKLGGSDAKWSCYRPPDVTVGNGSCICR